MARAKYGSLALLSGAFFASGAAALAFESLWFHQASLAFGQSAWASSLVLSAFMTGIALGNQLAVRFGDRLESPLRAFAALELGVAVSGVVLVVVLPSAGDGLAALASAWWSQPFLLNATRFALAFLLLLVPALAMGMSFPLLTRALALDHGFGRSLSILYGVNTLGAVFGTLATELLLLEVFGIRGSALCAGGLDLLAAAVALALARRARAEAEPASESEPETAAVDVPRYARFCLLAAAALAGAALLALEVVWLRIALLFLNDTPLAFAWVLACVLFGIAAGSVLASIALTRASAIREPVPILAYLAGGCAALAYRLYPWFLEQNFRADQDAATILALVAPLALTTSLASGGLFALLGAVLRRAHSSDAAAAGELAFANTLGAALGPPIVAFVVLPRFGVERALFGLCALYALVGVLAAAGAAKKRGLQLGAVLGFAFVLSTFPFGAMRASFLRASASRWMRPGDEVVRVREGANATYVQIAHRLHGQPLFQQIATNAYSMSVDDFAARRYMELFAFLPYALHPRIERALCIGYGIGNTARALSMNPELERLDVVDVAPDMLAIAYGIPSARAPLDDRRVHVRIEDGRHFLRAPGAGYDLITGEPPPPIIAGMNNLYSREYFALMRSRLAPGGFASYWLPLIDITADTGKALIHAFCDAFYDCSLWHGSARNLILLGTRDARGPVTNEQFLRAFSSEAMHAELTAIGIENPGQLGSLFIGDASYLTTLTRDTPPLSDDWPKRLTQASDDEKRAERDALLWEFRDTHGARSRFVQSRLVARLFPQGLVRASARQFENQRLVNDLLFPGKTPARQVGVLDQVLTGTTLSFPALLLLGSDPDSQRALAALPPAERDSAPWLGDRLAALLTARDFRGARALLAAHPGAQLALPGLSEYVTSAAMNP